MVRLDVILRPSWALLGPSWPIMGILGTTSGVIKYARAFAQNTGLLYFAARRFKHNILAAKYKKPVFCAWARADFKTAEMAILAPPNASKGVGKHLGLKIR